MAEEKQRRREIIVVNRTEGGSPSGWDYLERVAKLLSLVAIPIVLGFGGWWIQNALSQRTVSKDYVELAVSILSKSEGEIDADLRVWAVDLLNENSPVPFKPDIAEKLSKGEVSLPTLSRSPWYQPVSALPENDPRKKASRSIGSLQIFRDSQLDFCTAWIVSSEYIMTASYCVQDADNKIPEGIELILGYLSGDLSSTERVEVSSQFTEINRDLGYSLLKLEKPLSGEYPPMPLSSAPPKVGESLFITHHASGKSKTLSANPCEVLKVSKTEITHNCDTSAGVGGSPLMRASDLTVVGIHYSRTPSPQSKLNIAKRVDTIVQHSQILRNIGLIK